MILTHPSTYFKMKKSQEESGHMNDQYLPYKEVIKGKRIIGNKGEGYSQPRLFSSPYSTPHSAHRDFSTLLFTLTVSKPLQWPLLAFPEGLSSELPSFTLPSVLLLLLRLL